MRVVLVVFASIFLSMSLTSTPLALSVSSRGRAAPKGFGLPEADALRSAAALAAAAGSRFFSMSFGRPAGTASGLDS